MQRFTIYLTAVCLLLVTACAAVASGDDGHGLPWGNFAWRILNFALFVGVIVYFFGRRIVAYFRGRTQSICIELELLEKHKAAAEKSLEAVGERIANLENERELILADYAAQGEALKAAIIAQAEKNAEHIMAQAKATAQSEIQAATDAMRDEMAEKIVEATEKLLAARLTEAEHAKLIDNYLKKVVLN